MNCQFGHIDCQNINNKCYLCTDSFYYLAPKIKLNRKRIVTKETSRQGSISEAKNARNNDRMLTAVTTGTPNSGAGRIKGDEQIRGIINIMEEIKTTVKKNINKQPGKETFTIQRSWMDKLEAEAKQENMEFNYLKFSFKEFDDKFYIVSNQDVFMDMVVSMVHDRREAKLAQHKIDVAETRARLIEAENTKLIAEINHLKSKLKLKEYESEDSE